MSTWPSTEALNAAMNEMDGLSDAPMNVESMRRALVVAEPFLRAQIAGEVEFAGRAGNFVFPEWTDAVAAVIRAGGGA